MQMLCIDCAYLTRRKNQGKGPVDIKLFKDGNGHCQARAGYYPSFFDFACQHFKEASPEKKRAVVELVATLPHGPTYLGNRYIPRKRENE